jgi:16S rRNA A1518/A1519 N6-dimethyltransferase RsmA/KsgA/DIM1 with predicted DNA glycosylase/AP lyase activity
VKAISVEDAGGLLERAGIDPTARPEVISPESFARLFGLI